MAATPHRHDLVVQLRVDFAVEDHRRRDEGVVYVQPDHPSVGQPPVAQWWPVAVVQGFATAMVVTVTVTLVVLACLAVAVVMGATALWRVTWGKNLNDRDRDARLRVLDGYGRHVAHLAGLLWRQVGRVLAGHPSGKDPYAEIAGVVSSEWHRHRDVVKETAQPASAPTPPEPTRVLGFVAPSVFNDDGRIVAFTRSAPERPRRLSPNTKGWNARQRDASIADCPYRENSRRGRAWLRGYGEFIT